MGCRFSRFVTYAIASIVLALLWHPAAIRYLLNDFVGQDTIFHLAPVAQLGLALLSFLLFASFLWLNLYVSGKVYRHSTRFMTGMPLRFAPPLVDLFLTVLIFVCAISLVPQIHYFYYIQVFSYLPLQWVAVWPDFQTLFNVVTMNPIDSLNSAMSGLGFWSMLAGVLVFWFVRYTESLAWLKRVGVGVLVVTLVSFVFYALS